MTFTDQQQQRKRLRQEEQENVSHNRGREAEIVSDGDERGTSTQDKKRPKMATTAAGRQMLGVDADLHRIAKIETQVNSEIFCV